MDAASTAAGAFRLFSSVKPCAMQGYEWVRQERGFLGNTSDGKDKA